MSRAPPTVSYLALFASYLAGRGYCLRLSTCL